MNNATSTLSFGVRSKEAFDELIRLSKGLNEFKTALRQFNTASAVSNPLAGMASAAKAETSQVTRSLTEALQAKKTALAESQALQDAADSKALRSAKQMSDLLIKEKRQFELWKATGSGDLRQNLTQIESAQFWKAKAEKIVKAATLEGYVPAGAGWWDKVLAAQDKGAAKLLADQAKLEDSVRKRATALVKAATLEGYVPAGPEWWNKVIAEQEKGAAKLRTDQDKLEAGIAKKAHAVVKAATLEGYKWAGPAWWDAVIKEQERGAARLLAEQAKLEASIRKRAHAVVKAATQPGYQSADAAWWEKAIKDQEAAAVASRKALGLNVMGEAPIQVMGRMKQALKEHDTALKTATKSSDLFTHSHAMGHAALRGMSGALGVLWMTYSRYMPAMMAGFAAIATIRQSITSGVEFDYTTAFTAALDDRTSQGGAKAYKERLQTDIMDVAGRTQYSSNELAKGLRVLEQTGIDASKGVGLIGTAAQAALMGEVDLKTATQDLVAVMEVFKLRSDDPLLLERNFKRTGDVMAMVAKETQANLHDVAESMKQVTGLTTQYQVKLETAAAVAIQLGRAGIVGSRQGTFIRNMFENLYSRGTSEAQQLKKELQITPFGADGQYKEDIVYLQEVFDKLRSIRTEQERNVAVGVLFNERGGKPARELLAAFEKMGESLDKLKNSEGTLGRFAADMKGVAKVEWQTVAARWDDLMVKAFKGSEDQLVALAKQLQTAFNDPQVVSGLSTILDLTMKMAGAAAKVAEGWGRIVSLMGKAPALTDQQRYDQVVAQRMQTQDWIKKLEARGYHPDSKIMQGARKELADLSEQQQAMANAKTAQQKAEGEERARKEAEARKKAEDAAKPKPGKSGTLGLSQELTDPKAFQESQRLARAHSTQVMKEFTARTQLVQSEYKFASDMADKDYEAKLLSEEEWLKRKSALNELYAFDIATIAFEAEREAQKSKNQLARQSAKEQVDTAMQSLYDEMRRKEQAHELHNRTVSAAATREARVASLAMDKVTLPQMQLKEMMDDQKAYEQFRATLLGSVDQAGVQAGLAKEAEFVSSIASAIADVSKAANGSKTDLDLYVAALLKLLDAQQKGVKHASDVARAIAQQKREFGYGANQAFIAYADSATNAAEHAKGAFERMFKGMEDALVKFVQTGKFDFKSLADSIIADLIRIQIRQTITGPLAEMMSPNKDGSGGLLNWIGKVFKNAQGGVYSSRDLHSYANTIVSSPTLFRFAQGGAFRMGEMGEAGSEGIFPLARDSRGNLGVSAVGAGGGGAPNIAFNVINQTGSPAKARQSGPAQFDGEKWVIGIVLEAADSDPQFRNALGLGR